MPGQNLLRTDEVDSTNDRLDSILDALNALGDSASKLKVAPLRPLSSVPELDDDPQGDDSFDTVDDGGEDALPAANDDAAGEAIREPVEMRLVPVLDTSIEPPAVSPPAFVDDDRSAILPQEPEPKPDPEAVAVPTPPPFTPTEVESSRVDVPAVNMAAAPEPLPEPVPFADLLSSSEAPIALAPEPAEVATDPSVPLPELHEVEPVLPADSVVDTDTSALSVEPSWAEPQVGEEASTETAPVVDLPTGPLSIFGGSGVSAAPETPPAPVERPADDWMSHSFVDEGLDAEPALNEPVVSEPARVSLFDTPLAADSTPPPMPEAASMPHGQTPGVPNLNDADQAPSALERDPFWGDLDSLSAPEESPAFDAPDAATLPPAFPPTPAYTGEAASAPQTDYFAIEPAPDVPTLAGVPDLTPAAQSFETDADLPIPDFTGVYDETDPSNASELEELGATVPLAEGESSKTAAIARRAELDRLRPEDLPDQPAKKETVQRSSSTIFLGTFIVLVALAMVMIVFDPSFLADFLG